MQAGFSASFPNGLLRNASHLRGDRLSIAESGILDQIASTLPKWLVEGYKRLPLQKARLALPQEDGTIGFGEFAIVFAICQLRDSLNTDTGRALLKQGWVPFAQGAYRRGENMILIPDVLCVGRTDGERRLISVDRSVASGSVDESLLVVFDDISAIEPLK